MKKNLLPTDVKPARSPGRLSTRLTVPKRATYATEEGWVREWELSEACLFIPKVSFQLPLLTAIVLVTTRRDLVVATERGPCLVRTVQSL
jgi:hypothetical protein